ncbi:unnamed protein product [marine sediment metagenome]|uniref:Histidine kinase/HSP90-like ATPase domain-containing protein n=1 Tax=marine sediment metagenome TaxID=412755 RepID=X1PEL5_9ZZZZ
MWRARKLSVKQGELVALAVDEALSAIIRHAHGMRRPGEITIELDINNVRFNALIKDKTDSFDLYPLSESEQRISLEKVKKYQLGTFLICTIMDEVTYNYKKGFQNELQLIKFIP